MALSGEKMVVVVTNQRRRLRCRRTIPFHELLDRVGQMVLVRRALGAWPPRGGGDSW
jgi:hypothetical protein